MTRPILLDRAVWLAFTLAFVAQVGGKAYPTNWDALAYAALVADAGGASPDEARRAAYEGIERTDPTSAALVDRSDYTRAVASDPEAFRQQLGFYRARVLYVGAAGVLVRAGVPPYRALAALNALALAALSVLLLVAFRTCVPRVAGTLSVVVLLAAGSQATASLGTPDALVGALVVAGGLAVVTDRLGAAFAVLALAALARPDALLVGAALLGAGAWTDRDRMPWVAAAAGVVGVGLVAQWGGGGHGWATVFHHTFVEKLARPAEAVSEVGLGLYTSAALGGVRTAVVTGSALLLTVAATLATILQSSTPRVRAVALALLGGALAHAAVLPLGLGRFYLGPAALALVLLIGEVAVGRQEFGAETRADGDPAASPPPPTARTS